MRKFFSMALLALKGNRTAQEEEQLSRYIRGNDPLPPDLDERIRKLVEEERKKQGLKPPDQK